LPKKTYTDNFKAVVCRTLAQPGLIDLIRSHFAGDLNNNCVALFNVPGHNRTGIGAKPESMP